MKQPYLQHWPILVLALSGVGPCRAGGTGDRSVTNAATLLGMQGDLGWWGGIGVGVVLLLLGWLALRQRAAAELRAAKAAMQASEQRWKLLFEQSPLSVQIFDPDGQTKLFNDSWRRLFRLSDEQGIAFNVLQAPDLIESGAVNLIRKAFEGEVVQVPPLPFPVSTDPPEVRWIGGLVYPLKNEAGEILEVVVIHHDITEMKRAEQAMLGSTRPLRKRSRSAPANLRRRGPISSALSRRSASWAS